MSGLSMINEMNDLTERLNEAIRLMAKYGREYAKAEHDYKLDLKKQALVRRDSGMPVTLIDEGRIRRPVLTNGLKRDVAETMYKTAQENINSIKLQIRILDNQISREWGRGD